MRSKHTETENTDDYSKTKDEASHIRLAYSSGGEIDNPDWLSPLPIGSVFLAEPKKPLGEGLSSYSLIKFQVTGKSDRSTEISTFYMGQEIRDWVNPLRFTATFRKYDLLIDGNELTKAQEEYERNRTDK